MFLYRSQKLQTTDCKQLWQFFQVCYLTNLPCPCPFPLLFHLPNKSESMRQIKFPATFMIFWVNKSSTHPLAESFGQASFTRAAPSQWNQLPLHIKSAPNINIFNNRLFLWHIPEYKCHWALGFHWILVPDKYEFIIILLLFALLLLLLLLLLYTHSHHFNIYLPL